MFEDRPTYRELQSLPDEALMAHLRLGHHDAVAVILERYQRLVWSIAQKTLHDEGEAEYIVQIVFMELLEGTAKTRMTVDKLFNCSVHKYAGSRQPGISTNADGKWAALPGDSGLKFRSAL